MKWSKRHSHAAVAAKARKRIAEATADWTEPKGPRLRLPRRSRARFTVQIRDHSVGDSLTLNLHAAPWPNRWICEQGQFSSAHLGRMVALILQGGA